ncbi:MAG TPA: YkgJ family cysteine cluster protein [Candidatus Diapherotrites archaeon]|uniref:YkgJ family cysteine cluster protein n=1 Tax=Candidatus Iainarchaeum sp. TaxID=3101447 RepID=A0A7J4IY75_9ARCH|nr:YkgJ family cysteine cluster protein [Candidatus Diapherotrites archaeon]
MLNFKCGRCGECCKRYYVVSLPSEVKAQAALLKMPEKDFIKGNMLLFLQLFPSDHNDKKITVSSELLPKKFVALSESHLGRMPDFFIMLPLLAFRRRESGECTFYGSKNAGCNIYNARPAECRLFPFISDKKTDDYSKLYPFCQGLKLEGDDRSYLDLGFIHFEKMARYFSLVKEKGFSSLWGSWPKEGVILLTDKLLGKISEKDFFGMLGPYT